VIYKLLLSFAHDNQFYLSGKSDRGFRMFWQIRAGGEIGTHEGLRHRIYPGRISQAPPLLFEDGGPAPLASYLPMRWTCGTCIGLGTPSSAEFPLQKTSLSQRPALKHRSCYPLESRLETPWKRLAPLRNVNSTI